MNFKPRLFEKIMRMIAPTLNDDDRAKLIACYFPGNASHGLNMEAVNRTICPDSREACADKAAGCAEWLCLEKADDELNLMLADGFDGNSALYLAYCDYIANAAQKADTERR